MYYTRMAMLAYSRPKKHEVREKQAAEARDIYICAAVAVELCQKAPEWNGSAI
jgi:hypothetical protein